MARPSGLKRYEMFFTADGRRHHVSRYMWSPEEADQWVRKQWNLPPDVPTEIKCRTGLWSCQPWHVWRFGNITQQPAGKHEGKLALAARLRLGWTQEDVHQRLGISILQIHDLECGLASGPILATVLDAYAKAGIDLELLSQEIRNSQSAGSKERTPRLRPRKTL